jgi:hypothetical protein
LASSKINQRGKGGFAVKRKRFSVEQIVGVLKQAELGVPVAELILDKTMLQVVLSKKL